MRNTNENMKGEPMTESQIAIQEAAKQMKKAINALPFGVNIGRVHHSPVSNSIYYEIYHEDLNGGRPETVRISDHELARQTSYMLWDVIVHVHSFGPPVAKQLAEFMEDLEALLE